MAKKTTGKPEHTAMLSCRTFIKSIMDSVSDSMARLCSIYSNFCKETTLHGLKHTVAPNLHFLERLLWFLLTLGAFGGAVYCARSQLVRYNCDPLVVSLQRDYRGWWTAFPAVTACLYQRVQEDRAREVILKLWNTTQEEEPEKYTYYYEFVELVADVSFRTNLQTFWKYQSDDSVRNIDLLQLALDVLPRSPLNITTSDVQWIPVMTEEGLCATFNSIYAEFQLIPGHEWKKPQLLKCHYHSPECFVRIEASESAVRYFVHSPYDIATAISNPTGEILSGETLITDFKAVEIQAANSVKSLRPEQRRCRYPDEWISSSIRAYSFGLCQMHCRTKMAAMFCGCRPYFIVKGDGDLCDAHGMACIGRNVEILINLPKNLAKCPCPPQCTEINYYSHTKKNFIHCSKYDDFFLKVGLFANMNDTQFEEVSAVRFELMPPKFRLHRDVIFSLEDLFASLGGTTALFVGASVLTVVEMILFIIRYIVAFTVEKFRNRR